MLVESMHHANKKILLLPRNVFAVFSMLMENLPDIILASGSRDRKMILQKTGMPFRVVESAYDEESFAEQDPILRATNLAREKAWSVARLYPHALIIGGDTVIMGPDKMLLEKPKGKADVLRMMQLLSHKECTVVTGHCVVHTDKEENETVCLPVCYRLLSDQEIEEYVHSGSWQGMSGGINIDAQYKRGWVTDLPEDIDGIRGLSLKALKNLFQRLGYELRFS